MPTKVSAQNAAYRLFSLFEPDEQDKMIACIASFGLKDQWDTYQRDLTQWYKSDDHNIPLADDLRPARAGISPQYAMLIVVSDSETGPLLYICGTARLLPDDLQFFDPSCGNTRELSPIKVNNNCVDARALVNTARHGYLTYTVLGPASAIHEPYRRVEVEIMQGIAIHQMPRPAPTLQ